MNDCQYTKKCIIVCGYFFLSFSDKIYVRLVGGDQNGSTGRVEVARNRSGPWGSVCDDLWTEREAQVVCRNLHYQWGTVRVMNYHWGTLRFRIMGR